jgi:hypothetical protein
MSNTHPEWSDDVKCGICSHLLLPLTFRRSTVSDEITRNVGIRPDLLCPGCGQRYQWQDSTHWVPIHPVRAPLRVLH